VASITDEEFNRLLSVFEREALHLETRDAYGTAVELPHMAKWAAGEPDDLDCFKVGAPHCANMSRPGGRCAAPGSSPNHSAITNAGPTPSPIRWSMQVKISAGFPAELCHRWLFPGTISIYSMTG
jgi:hypothetical protein